MTGSLHDDQCTTSGTDQCRHRLAPLCGLHPVIKTPAISISNQAGVSSAGYGGRYRALRIAVIAGDHGAGEGGGG